MITLESAPPIAPSSTPSRLSWSDSLFETSLDRAQHHLCSLYRAGPSPRRAFRVREWKKSDGGFCKWTFEDNHWAFIEYPPRFAGELIVIERLEDGALAVSPKHWWRHSLLGMPADVDDWAAPAWREIELHFEAALALVKKGSPR